MFKNFFTSNRAAFETCASCGKAIHEGERYWSVQYAQETFDGRSVQVHDAVAVAYFCEACATGRDFDSIQVPLKEH
jgi:predicted RNA-binding Zn-ribbon protein involved in translation (DUF1610 family)